MTREELIEAGWQELKRRVCADPVKATRCVMVGRKDLAAVIGLIASEIERGTLERAAKVIADYGGQYCGLPEATALDRCCADVLRLKPEYGAALKGCDQ